MKTTNKILFITFCAIFLLFGTISVKAEELENSDLETTKVEVVLNENQEAKSSETEVEVSSKENIASNEEQETQLMNITEASDSTETITPESTTPTKSIIVDQNADVIEGKSYKDVQSAIDYIASQEDSTGWAITVEAGTYERFNVEGTDSLTITGEDGAIVNVLNGSSLKRNKYKTESTNGILINSANVIIEGLTFNMGDKTARWSAAAIEATDSGDTSMERANGLIIKNNTFNGNNNIGNGVFCDNGVTTLTITGNTFNNVNQGLYLEDYYKDTTLNISIDGNTYNDCAYAVHLSYDNNAKRSDKDGNVVKFTNNKVNGSDELRNKVIIQDSCAANGKSADVTIENNILNHAAIGTVNLENNGSLTSSPLDSNTYVTDSYYVDAIEPGNIDYYSTFKAPESEGYGEWYLTGKETEDIKNYFKDEAIANKAIEYINKAIDEANKRQDGILSITGLSEDMLIPTFTWFKNAIYYRNINGSLALTKEVEGSENTDEFSFIIKLENNTDNSYKTAFLEGKRTLVAKITNSDGKTVDTKVTFTDGVANIKLNAGETIIIMGIPADVNYATTEKNSSNYELESFKNATGKIVEKETINSTFVNKYISNEGIGETSGEITPPNTGVETSSNSSLLVMLLMLVSLVKFILIRD